MSTMSSLSTSPFTKTDEEDVVRRAAAAASSAVAGRGCGGSRCGEASSEAMRLFVGPERAAQGGQGMKTSFRPAVQSAGCGAVLLAAKPRLNRRAVVRPLTRLGLARRRDETLIF